MITDKDCEAVLPWLVYLAALQYGNALNWQRIAKQAKRVSRNPASPAVHKTKPLARSVAVRHHRRR